jgi:hypothetical protein
MAAAAEVIASETEIKQAMGVLGLDNWTNDLLDEIELDRQLQLGIEEIERGETITLEELEKRVNEKVANGYYRRK